MSAFSLAFVVNVQRVLLYIPCNKTNIILGVITLNILAYLKTNMELTFEI